MLIAVILSLGWTSYTNSNGVWDIVPKGDTFYMATTGGLLVFDPASESVLRKYTNIEGLPSVVLSGVALVNGDWPWVLCVDGGLAYMEDSVFHKYSTFSLPVSDPESILRAEGIWSMGSRVLVATREGLVVLDTRATPDTSDDGKTLLDSYYFGSDTVHTVYLYGDSVFVGSDSGLFVADTADFLNPSGWSLVYPYRPVYSVLRDDTLLLVGTNKGLRFQDDALLGGQGEVTDIAAWDGKIYFNTSDYGIWRAYSDTLFGMADSVKPISDTTQRRFKCPKALYAGSLGVWVGFGWISESSTEPQYFTGGLARYTSPWWHFVDLPELAFGVIGCMARTPDGSLWVGMPQPGGYPSSFMRFAGGQWKALTTVRSIFTMKVIGERLFLGCGDGIYEVDSEGNVLLHYGQNEGLTPSVVTSLGSDLYGNLLISAIAADGKCYRIVGDSLEYLDGVYVSSSPQALDMAPDGRIWYGTASGIYVFESQGDKWFMAEKLSTAQGLPSDDIVFIERHKGVMWVGTKKGLARARNGSFTTVLPDKEIVALEHEPGSVLWVWTTVGLYKIDTSGTVLEGYTPENSLLVGDGQSASLVYRVRNALVLVPEEDEIWVGTDRGISVLSGIGVKDAWQKGLYIYPNPLYLDRAPRRFYLPDAPAGSAVYLYTLDGKRITSAVLGPDRCVALPVSTGPGLYLVLVKSGDQSMTLKLVVE